MNTPRPISDAPARRSPLVIGCLLAVSTLGGCTVARFMATRDPGLVPRAAEFRQADAVGGEQVRFTFRFKAGRDPKPPAAAAAPPTAPGPDSTAREPDSPPPAPVATPAEPAPAGPPLRIMQITLNDTRGQPYPVVDQEIHREANAYTIMITSGAVSPGSYELICQLRAAVGDYQVRISGSAYRELSLWRPESRSFRFTVDPAAGSPWWRQNRYLSE